MKCEILRGDRVIMQNRLFVQDDVKRLIARHGGDVSKVPVRFSKKITMGTISIYPVREVYTADGFSFSTNPVRTVEDNAVVYTYGSQPMSVTEIATRIKATASKLHDDYEAGMVEYEGVFIAIDLEARINVTGLVDNFEAGVLTEQEWRGRTAPEGGEIATVMISSTEEAKALKAFITAAVAKGFGARSVIESELQALIDADDLEGIKAYNVQERFDAVVA